jgi:hypothetical protein
LNNGWIWESWTVDKLRFVNLKGSWRMYEGCKVEKDWSHDEVRKLVNPQRLRKMETWNPWIWESWTDWDSWQLGNMELRKFQTSLVSSIVQFSLTQYLGSILSYINTWIIVKSFKFHPYMSFDFIKFFHMYSKLKFGIVHLSWRRL